MLKYAILMLARGSGFLKDLVILYFASSLVELDKYFLILLWGMIPVVWLRDFSTSFYGSRFLKHLNINGIISLVISYLAIIFVFLGIFNIKLLSEVEVFKYIKEAENQVIYIFLAGFLNILLSIFLFRNKNKNINLYIDLVVNGIFIGVVLCRGIIGNKLSGNEFIEILIYSQVATVILFLVANRKYFGQVFRECCNSKISTSEIKSTLKESLNYINIILSAVLITGTLAVEQFNVAKLGDGWISIVSITLKICGIFIYIAILIVGRSSIEITSLARKDLTNNFELKKIVIRIFNLNIFENFLIYYIPLCLIFFGFSIVGNLVGGEFFLIKILYVIPFLMLSNIPYVLYQGNLPLLSKNLKAPLVINFVVFFLAVSFYLSTDALIFIKDYILYYFLVQVFMVFGWFAVYKYYFKLNLFTLCMKNINKILKKYESKQVGRVVYLDDFVAKVVNDDVNVDSYNGKLKIWSENCNGTNIEPVHAIFKKEGKLYFKRIHGKTLKKELFDNRISDLYVVFKNFGQAVNLLHSNLAITKDKSFNFKELLLSLVLFECREKINRNIVVHGDFVLSNVLTICEHGVYKYYIIDFEDRYSSFLDRCGSASLIDVSSFLSSIKLELRLTEIYVRQFLFSKRIASLAFCMGYFDIGFIRGCFVSFILSFRFNVFYFSQRQTNFFAKLLAIILIFS
jgi:hypothetical protein